MKRILTLILLFALIFSLTAVGTAFADSTATVVSEGERVTVKFKEGDYGGYFGSKEKIQVSSGESVYMEFDIHYAEIPATNYNIFVVPTTFDLNSNGRDYVEKKDSLYLYSNWAYGTTSGTLYGTENDFKKDFGSTAIASGTIDPTKTLLSNTTIRYEYTYETGNKSSYVVYTKPLGANEAAYTPIFELRNISDSVASVMQNAHFEFCLNGAPASINSNQGNFTLVMSNYKVVGPDGTEYKDPAIYKKGDRTLWEIDNSAEEGTDDKALNLVSNNTGADSHVAYYFNYSNMDTAEIKFSVPKNDGGLSVLLDLDKENPVQGNETKIALPADVENFKLDIKASVATLYNADTNDEISKTDMMFGLVYFGFMLENNATFTKNAYIDDLEIAGSVSGSAFEYKYGFNDGLANYFSAVTSGKGNFAQVHDSVYTVTFYYVDGTVIDTQVVGYGNNATIPAIVSAEDSAVAGEFANYESVKKQATFIDSDRGIYVERVDDDIDFIVVFVDGGILDDGNASMITRAGSSVTATLGVVPTGYKFTGWMIDGEFVDDDPTHTTYTFMPVKSTQLVACFENIIYKVNAVDGKIIAVNGIECLEDEVEVFYGDEVKVKANDLDPILDPGTFYVGWYIDGVEVTNSNQYWFNVTGDTEIVAKFSKDKINVSISNGHWNGQSTGIVVNYGTEIVAIPNAPAQGYRFAYWMINNVKQEDTTGDTSLRYQATEDANIIAVFQPLMYSVTVVGGTVDGETATNKSIAYGTEIMLDAPSKPGQVFAGWYDENDKLVSETASDFITIEGDLYLTAKYTTGSSSGCGCGCGSMTDGGNGGMWMLFGLVAILMAVVMLARRGMMKKFVKSALVLVLAVALLGGVVLSGAPAEIDADFNKVLSANGVSNGVLVSDVESEMITVESENFAIDIPTALFDIADKVIVSVDVFIDTTSAEETKQNDYSLVKLYNTDGVLIDDALPIGEYQTITFESQVLMKNGAFVVELIVKDGLNAKIKYKNAVLVEDYLDDELLAGTTLWMMPTWSSELNNSFVVETSSGELIVIDGGSATDSKYLVNFLYTRKAEVDHWFITNYSDANIGALANILSNDLITVNNVYYNLPGVSGGAYATVMANLSKTNAVELTAGQVVEIGDVEIKALNDTQNFDPENKDPENYNFAGNSTIVYRMDTLGESVLFLGCAGAELGDYLLKNCEEDLLGCEIIQTAGHAQNGVSKEFYETVGGSVYLNSVSESAWYANGDGTINSSKDKLALTTREWFRELGVVRTKCSFNGVVTIK